jgi:hypothetical protein
MKFGRYDGYDALKHMLSLEDHHGIRVTDEDSQKYLKGHLNFNPKNKTFVDKKHKDGVSFQDYHPILMKEFKGAKVK